jgi:hypothetical protein
MDWQPIILKALDTLPITVTAVGGTAITFYKILTKMMEKRLKPLEDGQADIKKATKSVIQSQGKMKKQLDGHTKMLTKATEAQGIIKGYQRAKRDARYDRRELVKVRKKVAQPPKSGIPRRRRTDR